MKLKKRRSGDQYSEHPSYHGHELVASNVESRVQVLMKLKIFRVEWLMQDKSSNSLTWNESLNSGMPTQVLGFSYSRGNNQCDGVSKTVSFGNMTKGLKSNNPNWDSCEWPVPRTKPKNM
ncbi:hypothetical protein TNCV_348601 [Trichonephila clavipes]|nr:hypothetical protein TNCV_348601 [Trichonephila clavipes]